MNLFLKATAGILITVLFCLALSKQNKDFSLLLTIAVTCIVVTIVITYLEPVIDFIDQLREMAKIDTHILGILIKAVGMGLLAEIVGLICADAGNSALGKSLKLLASAVILWLSIPLLTKMMNLLEEILVAV